MTSHPMRRVMEKMTKPRLLAFDVVHASPPCQAYSDLGNLSRTYPDLIGQTRKMLVEAGIPYVIENVDRAPLVDPVMLCGTMFNGLRVLRHPYVFTYDKRKPQYGILDQDTSFVQVTGGGNCTLANARLAMGIDWMNKKEINEAIPPCIHRIYWTTATEGDVMNEVMINIESIEKELDENLKQFWASNYKVDGMIDIKAGFGKVTITVRSEDAAMWLWSRMSINDPALAHQMEEAGC